VQTISRPTEPAWRRCAAGGLAAIVLAGSAMGVAAVSARAQDGTSQPAMQAPPLSAGRAAAQVGAGLSGTTVGFFGGGLATRGVATVLGSSDNQASSIGLVGAYSASALLTAAGPTLVGPGPNAQASYWAALGGTAVGGLGSILLIKLNHAVDLGHIPRIIGGVLVAALPSIGATIGYNLSRRYHQ
jgi:hypothetical protein